MRIPRPNERSGPLAGHVRKGRVYQSPLAATGSLLIGDWIRDDLPDLLWPVLALAELGTGEAVRFVRWQKDVQDDLSGRATASFIAGCLDGRLTNLDRLIARIPDATNAVRMRAQQHGLLPKPIVEALASYPSRPASWLLNVEIVDPSQAAIDLLARAVLNAIKDGHREAVIKCLYIWSHVQAGSLQTSRETIDLLATYPNDPAKREMADAVVRSMWGAHKGMLLQQDANSFVEAITWARVFWGVNSMTTLCMRRRDLEVAQNSCQQMADDLTETSPRVEIPAPSAPPEGGAHLRQLAMDLLSSYFQALETSPAHLYDHERQEVHAGLVSRAGRDVITALGTSDLWCIEHGAHITRVLVEVRIYLQWMALQDPAIYRSFQEYGAGKAKLYARVMNELPPDVRQPDFEEAIKELEKLSHNSEILDHRSVDTRDSFAEGKSIRAMAEECGLIDMYRQAYYMASGVAHSEWWSVEIHAMERCLNVLHAGHLIPSLSLNAGCNVELASSWVDQLYTLIRISFSILGTDTETVKEAFKWWTAREQAAPAEGED